MTFRANLGTKLGNAVFGEEQAMMATEAVLRISRRIEGSGKRLSNNCHPGKWIQIPLVTDDRENVHSGNWEVSTNLLRIRLRCGCGIYTASVWPELPSTQLDLSQTYRWPWHYLPIKSLLTQWIAIGPDLRKCTVPPENSLRESKLLYGLSADCATFCQMFAAHRPCVPSVCTKEPRTVAAGQGENWACSSISSCSSLLSWRPLKTLAMEWVPSAVSTLEEGGRSPEVHSSGGKLISGSKSVQTVLLTKSSRCLSDTQPSACPTARTTGDYLYLFTHWVLKKTTLKNTFSQGDQPFPSGSCAHSLPALCPRAGSRANAWNCCCESLLTIFPTCSNFVLLVADYCSAYHRLNVFWR